MSANITINIDSIVRNLKKIKSDSKKSLIFVIKGGVYGFGYELIDYVDELVDCYAISNINEYFKIKEKTSKQILILSPVLAQEIINNNQLIYSISSEEQLLVYKQAGIKNINCAIKINTGLNRYGFNESENLKQIIFMIRNDLNCNIQSVYTHLSASTSEDYGSEQTSKQLDLFLNCVKNNDLDKIDGIEIHYTDSASLLIDANLSDMTAIRTGMAVLGLDPIHRQSVAFPYEFPISIICYPLNKNFVKSGEFYGYEKRTKRDIHIITIGIGYCDGVKKIWIGEEIFEFNSVKLRLIDVSMNSSIIEVPATIWAKIELLKSRIIVINSQDKLHQLACLAKTSIEDVICGFNSINISKYYIRDNEKY